MSKTKIILSIVAVLFVIVIFLLPKAVVDNEASADVEATTPEGATASNSTMEPRGIDEMHGQEIPDQGQNLLSNLREKLKTHEDTKKRLSLRIL